MAAPAIYAASENGALRQGEILCNLVQALLRVEVHSPSEEASFDRINHPFVIVMSQDCDLDWDFKARQETTSADKEIPSVLFCQAIEAEKLRGRHDINSSIWARIKVNKDERYQFLERVRPEEDALKEGLPELGIDFKRYFTLPTEDVYSQIKSGAQRRSRLVSPYLEHLSTRFFYFQARVALPAEHSSKPSLGR